MSKDNSGPAFPCAPEHSVRMNGEGGPGMTLRDYFATRVMHAMISSSRPGGWEIGEEGKDSATVARISYEMADVMLAARSA